MANEKKEGKTFYRSVATGAMYMDKSETEAMGKHWGWAVAVGIVMILLGALAIIYPAVTSVGAIMLLGIILIAGGIAQVVHAFSVRGWGGFFWHILLALVYVVIGVMLLTFPLSGAITITLLLGIYFLVSGIFKVILSLVSREIPNWGWMLFSGIVALGLGVIVLLSWPVSAIWFLGLVVGVDLVIGGFSLAALGTSAHSQVAH